MHAILQSIAWSYRSLLGLNDFTELSRFNMVAFGGKGKREGLCPPIARHFFGGGVACAIILHGASARPIKETFHLLGPDMSSDIGSALHPPRPTSCLRE